MILLIFLNFKEEKNIIEDKITGFENSPEENFRKVMLWVKDLIGRDD